MSTLRTSLWLTCFMVASVTLSSAWANTQVPVQFFGGRDQPVIEPGEYDASVSKPADVLGFPLGDRPAQYAQVLEYFQRLADESPRVRLFHMGETYEGRPLVYAAISSEANIERLEEIKANVARIADPRKLPQSDLDAVVSDMPVIVWLAYSIHGDEVSGVDASMAVAYRLAAGTDTLTERLRAEALVLIDPSENPDGRARYLAQMEAFATAVPSADGQSLQKEGFWPWGRGNHYLFDQNRDWFAQELMESRARIATVVGWQPQVFVDAHEMGMYDTYLFSPPRQPFNPQITKEIRHWWDVFAGDQGRAFDRHGWAYYTRDWNEEWFPGYGSSWPLYLGGIGILYEQAGVSGYSVARHDGTVLTYSESVAHQYVSSMANVTTAADHREELLRHYYDHCRQAIEEYGGGPARAFLVKPDQNPDRLNFLAQTLTRQGIEIGVAQETFSANAKGYYEKKADSHEFPQGTLVIATNQPTGYLIQTLLSFDLRLPDSFLTVERREILKHRDSKLYEVTAWSMLLAYGVDAYEADRSVTVNTDPWQPAAIRGSVTGGPALQGYIFDASADRGLRAMAMLFERGLTLYAATKALDVERHALPRGSVFLPARANPAHYGEILDTVAGLTGIDVIGLKTGKGALGPDLGGGDVEVLRVPKVAIAAGTPTSFTSMGAIWHLLDQKLGLPASLLEVARLSWLDLSVYNVIILPGSWGSLSQLVSPPTVERIKTWVRQGGTLIAVGSSATFCTDSTRGISSVRLRRDVLDRLADFEDAAAREIVAEEPDMSGLQIWSYQEDTTAAKKEGKSGPSKEELKKQDELARIFSPHGVILKVNLDSEHWLTAGMGESVPVKYYSNRVYLAQFPSVRTVGRFAPAPEIRVGGLLWPEARLRLANSAYCTRESMGRGQVILFADDPNFRAYFRGAERLLSNAILYGPGLGTRWTPDW